MTPEPPTFPGYRFPAEIISHALWLYHVFGLSLRDVELILAERGIGVSHESIRQWCLKFGGDVARKLRRRRPRPGGRGHGRARLLACMRKESGMAQDAELIIRGVQGGEKVGHWSGGMMLLWAA